MTDIPEVHLSKEALFEAAQKQTGLSDWGTFPFEVGLDVLLDSIEREANLNAVGRFGIWTRTTQILSNWLKLQADGYRNAPADGKGKLFVLGLPRSGTTLLQRLLSQDPQAGFLRFTDVQFLTPATKLGTQADEEKLQRCRELTTALYERQPALLKIHELLPDGPEEDISLFEHQFTTILFPIRMHVPSYTHWYLESADHIESYRELERMTTYIGQYREFGHWVFKTPQHLFTLDALLDVLPEAKVVWIHRDPLKVVPSMCNLSWLAREGFTDAPSPTETKRDWFDTLQGGLDRAVTARKRVDGRVICDVLYHNLMEDPVSEIQRVYTEIGMTFSAEMEIAMRDWLAENPQNKYGHHSYSLAQFGLNKEEINDQFFDYTQRFSIPREE